MELSVYQGIHGRQEARVRAANLAVPAGALTGRKNGRTTRGFSGQNGSPMPLYPAPSGCVFEIPESG